MWDAVGTLYFHSNFVPSFIRVLLIVFWPHSSIYSLIGYPASTKAPPQYENTSDGWTPRQDTKRLQTPRNEEVSWAKHDSRWTQRVVAQMMINTDPSIEVFLDSLTLRWPKKSIAFEINGANLGWTRNDRRAPILCCDSFLLNLQNRQRAATDFNNFFPPTIRIPFWRRLAITTR